MGISEARDLEAVRHGFTRWLRAQRPDAPDLRVAPIEQPPTGLSSETLFLEVDWSGAVPYGGSPSGGAPGPESLVARLPPNGDGLFPVYDLAAQGRVQEMVADAGFPAVAPLAAELDDTWVGAPFLLMPRVEGRVVRIDQPFLRTGWLAEAPLRDQARLHAGFLDLLAGIHRVDVTTRRHDLLPGAALADTGAALADTGGTLAGEVDRWAQYLAWFLVLHRMTVERCGRDLPGFPGHAATVGAYETRLGRPLADLRWFEVFAALRSGAIMVRVARLLARLGADDSWLTRGNPTVTLLADLVAG